MDRGRNERLDSCRERAKGGKVIVKGQHHFFRNSSMLEKRDGFGTVWVREGGKEGGSRKTERERESG